MKKEGQQSLLYRSEVIVFVERQVVLSRKIGEVLKSLGVSRSTYYNWKKMPLEPTPQAARNTNRKITPAEVDLVLKAKEEYPQCRHRQIQGIIQNAGAYISESSLYKVLKENGLVESFERREAPWKKPRYEVSKRNLMWGADWTKIKLTTNLGICSQSSIFSPVTLLGI